MASALTPREGIVHEWITSVEEATKRIGVFIGRIIWLDEFISRGILSLSINESN
jgi:hypothetical protein